MESEERKKGGGGEDKAPNPKRQMKTPSQLEVLERVYADNRYPSEAVRAELAVQLSLTDRQLQMWFCHRRLKDRKDDESPAPGPSKKQKKDKAPKVKESPAPPPPAPAPAEAPGIGGHAMGVVSPSMALPSSSLVTPSPPPPPSSKKKSSKKKQQARVEQPVFTPEQHAELAAIQMVEQQLGEPLREDGPVLGCEFDPLPPGAFDTPIEPADQRMYSLEALRPVPNPEFPSLLGNRRMSPQTTNRIPREHQFIPEHPTVSQLHERSLVSKVERDTRAKAPAGAGPLIPSLSLNFFHAAEADADHDEPPPPKQFFDIERPPPPEPPSKKRKFQSDDAKLARELELQEKRLKREADKQEAARRKREEQERKEIEKMNRERQKEIEKINRERQREEERLQREQKKEQDRMEKLALKEQQRLEKLRVKEEQRRQKEAAKMQAAYERATAKKLAKLSTGLLEDEQLELMQMGAFVQGLVTADMEGANFDTSKVELKKYPPASVRMKKVLGIAPWESQQNVANLLMVWRFLTTFSDAIGLWPFTVDEFVQGLHDFDSRLLNEIYVALLKTLIKDVEDAAQAAASGPAGSQHAIAVAAGGHPQIVEAAYTWGFDIQEWGQHMNPLTWPEVLRQFALAAGYGPRWKKRSSSTDQKSDFTEVNDGHNANAIATLRSGAAAVNAVALMRGKNATRVKLKKAQMPKLTPGTVKYAAFHVLSIEGGKGLTITELTDRIQKSGLRDLSSSKTPEASISAALSRDTVLFERVAPSTYCVRSPFRRDTDEAEDVIQAALERTYLYQTRQLDPDKADELVEDAEDESEGDEQDTDENEAEQEHEQESADPETNYDTPVKPGKVILRLKTGKVPQASAVSAVQGETSTVEPVSVEKDDTKLEAEDEVKQTRTSIPESVRKEDDDMEIDESQVGEPWVQGLMEGEFADLSIEERLNALVALVDVLNEGNTIRSVLEARYEAASAFKRQLWEEVQVDKRRLKEELTKSGAKAEIHDDERQNHATDLDNVASTSASLSDKSRVQVKAEIRLRAEKLYVIRSLPLGSDRRYNRYWLFAASTGGEDPGRARIYFESNEDGHFEVIDAEEALDALLASLDTRGVRESSLYNALTQIGGPLRKAMKSLAQLRASDASRSQGSPSSGVVGPSDVSDVSSAISVELGRNNLEIQHAMERFKDLEGWLWNRCLMKGNKSLKAVSVEARQGVDPLASCEYCHSLYWPTENHCSTCHTAIEEESHSRECEGRAKALCSFQVPPRFQLLKHLLVLVEVAIPTDAFKSSWTSDFRKSWCDDVKNASSVRELLQAFTVLEGSMDERWISSSYETTEKALSWTVGPAGSHLKNLPWVPQTTAAVALRLCAFDAAIAFNTEQRAKFEQKDYMQQQAPAVQLTRGHDESPSSPDSDSPPDFPNGHARLPPRSQGKGQARMRACNANSAGSRKLSVKVPKAPQRQPAQQQGRGKGRLSFRVQGRVVSSNDSYQREDEEPPALIHHPPPPANVEDEDSDGWERQSDETEHSDDEPEQAGGYYHEQHHEAAHHHGQMPQHEQNEQEETDEDEDEYEDQQQPQEQYEEEYYDDEYDQNQPHQHQQAQPAGGMMMMMDDEDEEVEVEEVEEVEEEEEEEEEEMSEEE